VTIVGGIGVLGSNGAEKQHKEMSGDFLEGVERVPQWSQFAATYGF
jgi:hypothetical protein